MRYYHRTDVWPEIEATGWRDGSGGYGTGTDRVGVWISDQPLTVNEGAAGRWVVAIDLPDGVDLSDCEWKQDGAGYREWQVPASILNDLGLVVAVLDDVDPWGLDPSDLEAWQRQQDAWTAAVDADS